MQAFGGFAGRARCPLICLTLSKTAFEIFRVSSQDAGKIKANAHTSATGYQVVGFLELAKIRVADEARVSVSFSLLRGSLYENRLRDCGNISRHSIFQIILLTEFLLPGWLRTSVSQISFWKPKTPGYVSSYNLIDCTSTPVKYFIVILWYNSVSWSSILHV